VAPAIQTLPLVNRSFKSSALRRDESRIASQEKWRFRGSDEAFSTSADGQGCTQPFLHRIAPLLQDVSRKKKKAKGKPVLQQNETLSLTDRSLPNDATMQHDCPLDQAPMTRGTQCKERLAATDL
jgi:hypothetical protein